MVNNVAPPPSTPSPIPVDLVHRRAEFLSSPQWAPGNESRETLCALTDTWLSALFKVAGGAASGAALVALGGYGRRELAPGSDLDLLLLHPPGAAVSALADGLWYPIWDAGIKLDHSVRSVPEARRLAATDLPVMLGLLDARTVVGDDTLAAALRSSVLADWRSLARDRLPALRALSESRADRAGDLAHLLEPDLKESHGGLRDIVVLRAVAASWLADIPHATLLEPHRVLLDVRDALHRVNGRGSDRLVVDDQAAVAAMLGASNDHDMLREVARAGRAVAYAADLTWSRVERVARPKSSVRRLAGRSSTPGRVPLAEGVVAHEGEVVLALEAHPAHDPVLVLRAAAAAAQAGLSLSPHAVERLATECPPMPVPWPREARDSLVSLLGAGRPTLRVWEALDQRDVWSGLIPEWQVLRCAAQRNPIHMFTVDRHLVEAAIWASALTRRVRRPDLLLVGALVHDIGKARGGDHTEVGMGLVAEIAPRLGFDEADCAVLVDLVRHHLLLPEVATRRDLDDPATIEMVAAAVPDPDTLDLLAALTEADSLATGPSVWSEWKGRLIDTLVERVHSLARGGTTLPAPALTDEQRALARGSGLEVLLEADGPATRITVLSPDRVGLLAATAGVLSLHRLGVRSAQTETLGDRVVSVWTVLPTYGDVPAADRVRDDLRRALEGSLDLAELLGRRDSDQRSVPTAAPDVLVVPGASARASVLEVRAHDAPGLLYRVASTISAAGVDITAALVSTLGSEVVDVFYVQSPEGGLLAHDVAVDLRRAVLDALTSSRAPAG